MTLGTAPAIASKLPRAGTNIFTVMSSLAERCGAVNLGQGFPDFNPSSAFEQSLVKHMRAGHNQYAPMAGVPRLTDQIAQKLERDYGSSLNAAVELTVTCGATEGIFSAVAACVHPGDELILLDPCYDCYHPAVVLQGGRPVHLPLRQDFGIDFQRLQDALSERTRLVVLNFPHNPSGALLSADDLDALAELLRPTRTLILSDEVYEHIVFDGVPHQSLLRNEELAARAFVVSSFGKSHHTTGWKVGWVVAPEALTAELRRVHQYVTFSACHPAQHAFADLLECQGQTLKELPRFYQRKRDLFRSLMGETSFELLPAASTYFQLVDYSPLVESRQIGPTGDVALAKQLCAQTGVAAIPVSVFCEAPPQRNLLRFCFCKDDKTLKAGADRLRSAFPRRAGR